MTSSFKLLAAFASVSFISLSAFAARVYEIPAAGLSIESVSIESSDIIDSIPQLGVIITRAALNENRASGLKDLGDVSQVHLIEPKVRPSVAKVPASMWGLRAIGLAEAWKVSQGAGVIVAISDTGVSATHSLLASQMWKNPGEVGADAHGNSKSTNQVDDDGNGYVDDVFGWDFVNNKGGGTDHHFHGTHVAGTIAAKVSPTMAGIAPGAKIMDVSFLDSKGSGDDVKGAKSLVYAVDQGAKIINCSWGGSGKDALLEKALKYASDHGVLVIAAAGNNGKNNDKVAFYPSGYNVESIVSIGAEADASGTVAAFSNYGKRTVDLAAPGQDIYSLAPGNGYQSLSGTSMATPHVAGVAALVWSAHPNYTWDQVKRALMAVKPNSFWRSKSVSGGTLDAVRAVTH